MSEEFVGGHVYECTTTHVHMCVCVYVGIYVLFVQLYVSNNIFLYSSIYYIIVYDSVYGLLYTYTGVSFTHNLI